MRHLHFVFFILLLFPLAGIKAQQNHFIYIQTEGRQPFYIKLDKKIYSSSASGYLLISKLQTATYNLAIGFPKSEWSEQNIQCKIEDNDIGFLLKNFGSKGWGLFNLQSLDVIMSADERKVANVEVVNKTDAFSTMLSTVVNDSTIRQTEVVKEEIKAAPKGDEKTIVTAVDEKETTLQDVTAQAQKDELKKPVSEKATATVDPVDKSEKSEITTATIAVGLAEQKSVITRSLLNKNSSGTEMIFIDDYGAKKDTIIIFIPSDNKGIAEIETKVEKSETKPVAAKKATEPKKPKFIEIEPTTSNTKKADGKTEVNNINNQQKEVSNKPVADVSLVKQVEVDIQKPPMINSDCKINANNEDFLKLRKKMVSQDNDDDMVMAAKKVFKTKCFSVEQVKNLSVLFLKDSGKYAFFDLAYSFVSDSHNFSTLQNQLSETYYLNRFQVMVRH